MNTFSLDRFFCRSSPNANAVHQLAVVSVRKALFAPLPSGAAGWRHPGGEPHYYAVFQRRQRHRPPGLQWVDSGPGLVPLGSKQARKEPARKPCNETTLFKDSVCDEVDGCFVQPRYSSNPSLDSSFSLALANHPPSS
ncbi:hypothetical protein G7046_g9220 [Stylonectria norvegica]|nr:hypothetical protein G7046_g9220 [Stylonectria norvegica]